MRRLWVLVAIAAGGVIGAEARYAVGTFDTPAAWIPWATLSVNVIGCLLIGVLMTVLLELTAPHRLLRPFLGIGVLGGFTTFSGYAVGVQRMLDDERVAAALVYLGITPLIALTATWLGVTTTNALIVRRRGA